MSKKGKKQGKRPARKPATKSARRTKAKKKQMIRWWLIVVGILLSVGTVVGVLLWVFLSPKDVKEIRTNIPRVELNFAGGTTFEDFKNGAKTTKYHDNHLTVLNANGEQVFKGVTVKGRGNTTWTREKRPMQIKLQKKTDFLGMEKAKKWVFLANSFDASQIRNDTALHLSTMLDFVPSLEGRFAELTVDGDYQGLYYVTHQVEINKNVVDLRDDEGVLVEIDNLHQSELRCYTSEGGMCISMKDMVNKELEDRVMANFLNDFNALEVATKKYDYKTVESLIDVDSFAKYYLLSEFTVNPDAYTSSWFMYKDGEGDKIHAGPGWDYDLALGNHEWVWKLSEDFYSPNMDMIREVETFGGKVVVDGKTIEKEPDLATSKIIYRLMKMPEFRDIVKMVFNERMHGRKNELLAHMEKQLNEIYPALLRNEKRWDSKSFVKESKYLFDWVAKRYDHFEEVYGNDKGIKLEFR